MNRVERKEKDTIENGNADPNPNPNKNGIILQGEIIELSLLPSSTLLSEELKDAASQKQDMIVIARLIKDYDLYQSDLANAAEVSGLQACRLSLSLFFRLGSFNSCYQLGNRHHLGAVL